jgi:hypothetical protein
MVVHGYPVNTRISASVFDRIRARSSAGHGLIERLPPDTVTPSAIHGVMAFTTSSIVVFPRPGPGCPWKCNRTTDRAALKPYSGLLPGPKVLQENGCAIRRCVRSSPRLARAGASTCPVGLLDSKAASASAPLSKGPRKRIDEMGFDLIAYAAAPVRKVRKAQSTQGHPGLFNGLRRSPAI